MSEYYSCDHRYMMGDMRRLIYVISLDKAVTLHNIYVDFFFFEYNFWPFLMCRNWRPFWLFSLCRRILGSKTKFELCRRIVWFSVKTHFVDAILRFYTLSTQFSVFKLCRRNSKCFSEEMRRQSEILSKCVDKVIFWRNASTKWNSVYFEKTREKCVDKVIFDKIKEQCVDKVETPFLGFKNCTSKMAKNRDICTQKKKNGHIP